MRSLEVAAHETNQPIKLIGDLSQAHIDVSHALLMQSHALLHVNDVLGLKFLYLGLTALDLRHHDRGVLKLPDFLFEVHPELSVTDSVNSQARAITPFHLRMTSSARLNNTASPSNPGQSCSEDEIERPPPEKTAAGSGWKRPPV